MKYFIGYCLFFIIVFCITACNNHSNHADASVLTDSPAIKLQLVTDALKSPVEMVAAPDSSHRLFIADLSGKIFIMQNGRLLPHPFIDVSSRLEQKDTAFDMRAIYSIAFHPKFAENKKFYICFNAPANDTADKCKLVVAEFKQNADNPNTADLSSEHEVIEIPGKTIGKDDCRIAFGPDGYLYISVGDNGTPFETREAQHLDSYLGKLLRIDVDKTPYGIPADNPFINNKNVKPEIWSYGLRRLWRFSFDAETGLLIGADVGNNLQEEVDIIQKGGNYGWPLVEGDSIVVKNTDTSKLIAPVNTYSHNDGICIIGGCIYNGSELPYLKNKYVFADFTDKFFTLTKSNNTWIRQPLKLINAPADAFLIYSLDTDENNEMYVLGILNGKTNQKGVIYKLVHS